MRLIYVLSLLAAACSPSGLDLDPLEAPGRAVRLAWDAPTTKADGSPLDGPLVYRVYQSAPGGTPQIAAESSTTQAELEVDPELLPLLFHVTAVDVRGNESEASNVVEVVQ